MIIMHLVASYETGHPRTTAGLNELSGLGSLHPDVCCLEEFLENPRAVQRDMAEVKQFRAFHLIGFDCLEFPFLNKLLDFSPQNVMKIYENHNRSSNVSKHVCFLWIDTCGYLWSCLPCRCCASVEMFPTSIGAESKGLGSSKFTPSTVESKPWP